MRWGRLAAGSAMLLIATACGDGRPAAANVQNCDDLDGPGGLVAFDLTDGSLLWSRKAADLHGAIALGDTVAAISPLGTAAGFDLQSGEPSWCVDVDPAERPAGRLVYAALVEHGGSLATVLPSGTGVTALDPATGADRWRVDQAIADNTVLRSMGDRLVALDASLDPGMPDTPDLIPTEFEIDAGGSIVAPGEPVPSGLVAGDIAVDYDLSQDPARQMLQVSVTIAGAPAWQRELPGIWAYLFDDLLVLIDQTGGTGIHEMGDGPPSLDTRITGYDVATGSERWQVGASRTANRAWRLGDLIVYSAGAELVALDHRTGNERWRVNHGSPGKGGSYSEDGIYFSITASSDHPGVAIGLIEAVEPYRD